MNPVFLHLRDTTNIGDRHCSPYDYFDWPQSEARDLRSAGKPYDIGIYGGGKIFGGLNQYKGVQRGENAKHIAWGVSTVQSFPISRKYAWSRKLCDLVGTRDYGDNRYEYAPCASCMAPFFDNPPDPTHDVVFYYHGGKTDKQKIKIPTGMPSLSNYSSSLSESLSFIASGKTVVSNSYHGVYWALLMGRQTVCIPFSRKFSAFRQAPFYTTPKRWINDLNGARSRPEMLGLCRSATLEFKSKVDTIITESKNHA